MEEHDDLEPTIEALQKVVTNFRPQIVEQKKLIDAHMKTTLGNLLRCNEHFLMKFEDIKLQSRSIDSKIQEYKKCRGRQLKSIEILEHCETHVPDLTKKAEEVCATLERKYKSIPEPENVWALQCDVRIPQQTVHEYLMAEFEFWDTLGKKHDQYERDCKDAWVKVENATAHCLSHAGTRESTKDKCDALQDQMEDHACKQSVIDAAACHEYGTCRDVSAVTWTKLKEISCGENGHEGHLKAQMQTILILECILFSMKNGNSNAIDECTKRHYDLSKFDLDLPVCNQDVDAISTKECSYSKTPASDPHLPGSVSYGEYVYRGISPKTPPKECVATCCLQVFDCPVHSHAMGLGGGCLCNAGFKSDDFSLISPYCTAVLCPEGSFGLSIARGCKCRAGWEGYIKAKIGEPYYEGGCSPAGYEKAPVQLKR